MAVPALVQQQTAQDISQVIKIGPAKLYIAAAGTQGDLSLGSTPVYGFMSVKGANVKWAPKTTDAKISKYGDTAVATFLTGGELTLEFESSQTNFYIFSQTQISTNLASSTANGGTPPPTDFPSGTGFGLGAGGQLTPVKLQLIPEQGGKAFAFTMHRGVALGEPEVAYTSEGAENVYKVKFKALVAETVDAVTIPDGSKLGFWGDPAIY